MTLGFVPTCTILAGPNGAGKSTIVEELAPDGEVVNADDYARRLNPNNPATVSYAAGRAVLERIAALITDRQSFNYETTLSSKQSIDVMVQAQRAGFRIGLVFLVLRSPDLHVARVRSRVASGGHAIPTDTILRRYNRSLAHLPAAIALADEVIIYDNTAARPVTLCRVDRQSIVLTALDQADMFHRQIADLTGKGLGMSPDQVFKAPSHD